MRDRLLATGSGKQYWRSLEELAETDEFRELVEREYPQHAEQWDDPVGRRSFLKIMGASLALAGLSGCVYQPPEQIVPYVKQPDDLVPGKPLFFATAMPLFGGAATGLLARSNEGRPTKIEGNPDHPASLGATDLFAQASILTLYDPDRSQTPIYREETRPWSAFLTDVSRALDEQRGKEGAGLRFLTETITSPTLASQIRAILAQYPAARWYQYEPANRDNVRAGARLAFGQPVNTIYRFDQAARVLALDADFLIAMPGSVRYARDFIAQRRVGPDKSEMNRLYVVESTPTITGAMADHRLALRPSEMEAFARAVAAGLGARTGDAGIQAPAAHAAWISAVIKDLQAHKGKSIVIAGDEQPPIIHALAHAMNDALGNVGATVIYTDPIEASTADQIQGLRELAADLGAGKVDLLVILGGNPVYTAPADLDFGQQLMKAKLRVHLGLYRDETAELCHWHIPEAHYLEAWSDARAYDGTVSIIQPLIEPLYDGKSAHEFLAVFAGQPDRKGYDIVRDYWKGRLGAGTQAATQGNQPAAPSQGNQPAAAGDFERQWRKAVHDGVIPNTAFQPRAVALNASWAEPQPATGDQHGSETGPHGAGPSQPPAPGSLEILFRADPSVYDGRFANNGWLQELPKPLTKLTWDNAALISPQTAKDLGLTNKITSKGSETLVDVVELEYQGRKVSDVPIWIMPGQPDNVITVHLGYGRKRAGRVGTGQGFNAYLIRTSDALWSGTGLKINKTGAQKRLASTQTHFNVEGRDHDIIRTGTLDEYLKAAGAGHVEAHGAASEGHQNGEGHAAAPVEDPNANDSLYPPYDYKDREYAWGMAIDMNNCIGCNACVVACQSENNIPVVGKEQVARSREMHWLRIDAYFKGADPNNPAGPYFQPVPCMQCENAPCEPVCPVHATVHSAEGLNDMVYNRCVGTRYCSNNCPYKVRRFNFLLYQDWNTPTYKLMRNPEVTIRSRGVMEKCTYCIQRIQNAKIEAEKENRSVRDGEILTACQAVCPTQAIVFGNINDPASQVSRLKADRRNYAVLEELNTRPRTTYLTALRNPNPEITEKKA